MDWRTYHDATRHSLESLRRTQHYLDWVNMPDPFRHYEGAPVLDLPAGPPVPESPAADGPAFLSQLLFYSAAISASKRVASTGGRYALRVNPSSGNLHPTEFHFFTRGLRRWPDGLYHYRPSCHMAEQRARGAFPQDAPITFVLTSIAWREAWKYRDRAYRYCLLDLGHAWAALTLAARAIGCGVTAIGRLPDDDIARTCRLSEDEWPLLVLEVRGATIPMGPAGAGPGEPVWFGGRANQLSAAPVAYPLIDEIHAATKPLVEGPGGPAPSGSGDIGLPLPEPPRLTYGEVARTRRSALDFVGGTRSMSLPQLSTLLSEASQPFDADFAASRFVQLYLYAHRIDGLPPGVYRHWPQRAELELIRAGDQRVAAAGLSLGQDLAGNACVAFSMIGDLERATRAHGDRGYRYVFFEAGAIGHRLYLAAESLGLRATGIGAFFDEQVRSYLFLAPEQGQAVYHFAIGYPVEDPRLEG